MSAPARRFQMNRIGPPKEFLAFAKANKKWWILPILLAFLLLAGLVFVSSTAVIPFTYILF